MKYISLGCVVILCGCSAFNSPDGVFHDRAEDYVASKRQPDLQFSEPTRAQSTRFVIPASETKIEKPLLDPRPPFYDEDMEQYSKG